MWNVDEWLKFIPHTSEAKTSLSPVRLPLKRSASSGAYVSPRKAPRLHLTSRDPNLMPPRAPRAPRTPSPTKRAGKLDDEEDENRSASIEDARDSLSTPKPAARTRLSRRGVNAISSTQQDEMGTILAVAETDDRRFSTAVSFPPDSQSESQTSSSTKERSSKRTRSPVKDTVDLRMAERPIQYQDVEEMQLPPDMERLLRQLKEIRHGKGVVPACVRERVEQLERETLPEFLVNQNYVPPVINAARELDELVEIWQAARLCQAESMAEASWNDEVHSRILRVAFRSDCKRLRHFNVDSTTARPVATFLPRLGSEISESKLVDYTVNIQPTRNEESAISKLLLSRSPKQPTISQTMYTPLRLRPVAFSIETKADAAGGDMKARVQLGVWSAAHFARLRTLLGTPSSADEEAGRGEDIGDRQMPIHPLLHVYQHAWNAYYSCAQGDRIDVVDLSIQPGGSKTIVELYKVVAALRCLGRWAQEEFWPQFRRQFLSEGNLD